MTDTITIPPEVVEAGKDSAFLWLRSHMEHDVRVQEMTDEELGELVSAACLAMLRAWRGMHSGPSPADARRTSIILPLPQPKENGG